MSGSEILGKLVKGGEILELGAEFGGSTEVLSDVCISKGGHLTTVDWWLGRDDVYDYFEFKFKNITTIIRKNLFDCEFKDSQFDTIYFDAIYSYPECVAMLRKYLPYLKKGGLAVGHGGDFWWSKVSPDIQKRLRYYIDRTKTAEICFPVNMEFAEAFAAKEYWFKKLEKYKDTIWIPQFHAALSLSLYEVFNDEYEMSPDDTFWWRCK